MLSAMIYNFHDRVERVRSEKGEEAAKKYAEGEPVRYLKATAGATLGLATGDPVRALKGWVEPYSADNE